MSRFPITRFGRRSFDFDRFFGPSLDLFDPFDTWDLSMKPTQFHSLDWIREPPRLESKPADKFRITIPIHGYDKSDITTYIENKKLKVRARHEEKGEDDDFNVREFSKSFPIPDDVDASKLTSFITSTGTLVVEIPFMPKSMEVSTDKHIQIQRAGDTFGVSELFKSSFSPQIVEDGSGAKKVEMNVELKHFRPEQIQLTLKDRDIILKAESQEKDSHYSSKQYVYRQVSLPHGTDVDRLFSTFENGLLHIEAPFHDK